MSQARVTRARERYQEARDWFLSPRPDDPLVLRCLRELLTVDARDRVLMLAGQAFIALIPLLILTATILTRSDSAAVSGYLIDRFELTGDVASSVNDLFARPPDTRGPVSLVSLVVVLVSVNSFARSVRRTMERAWDLPGNTGLQGTRDGLLGLAALLANVTVVGWLTSGADAAPVVRVLLVVLQMVVGTGGWLLVLKLLLSRRHSWQTLLPGAAFASALQLLASWGTSIWMPRVLAHDAERYGVIGIALALVAWMVVMAAVLVTVGVVSAESARSLEARER